jgi:hypothetical protein
VIGDIGEEGGVRPFGVDQIGDGRRDLAGRIGHEGAVLGVGHGRHVAAGAGPEADAAGVAGARPHRHAAVIGGRVTEHVEEEAVDLVALERFTEDGQRVPAVVVAVDAGRVEPVVDRRLSVAAAEEPLRVCIEDGLLRLAQVEPADDANPARVRLAQHVAEQVAAGGQEGARVVERRPRRILRDDAAHVDEEGVGAGLAHGRHQRHRIDDGIALGEIGLQEPDWLGQPPAGRSGLGREPGREPDREPDRERPSASAHGPTIAQEERLRSGRSTRRRLATVDSGVGLPSGVGPAARLRAA